MSVVNTFRAAISINRFLLLTLLIFLFIPVGSYGVDLKSRQSLLSPPIVVNQDFAHRLIVKFKDNIQMRVIDNGAIVSTQKTDSPQLCILTLLP